MVIKCVPDKRIAVSKIARYTKRQLDNNETAEKNRYAEGYHDALVEILNWLEVEHDQNLYK